MLSRVKHEKSFITFASDQGLHCPLTKLLDITEGMNEE